MANLGAISLICILTVTAGCTFPSDFTTDSIWKHSFHDTVRFTANNAFNISIDEFGTTAVTCDTELTSGSRYIVKSDVVFGTYNGVAANYYVSFCLNFEKLGTYKYKVTHQTSEISSGSYSRMYVALQTAVDGGSVTLNEATVCNDVSNTEYYLLMKDGEIATTKIDCPVSVQGNLDYTIIGDPSCSGDKGKADICTDKTLVEFDYTICPTNLGYSTSGKLNCVYSTTSGATITLWVWNNDTTTDESTTFRFACFLINVDDTTKALTATQNFRFCDDTQTYSTTSTGSTSIISASSGKITGTLTSASCSGTETIIGQRSTFLWILIAVFYQMS